MAEDAPVDAGTDDNAGPETADPAGGPTGSAPGTHAPAIGARTAPSAGNGESAETVETAEPARTGAAADGGAVPVPAAGASANGVPGGPAGGDSGPATSVAAAEPGVPAPAGVGAAGPTTDRAEAQAGAAATTTGGAGVAGAAGGDGAETAATQRRGGFWRELPVLVVIAVALAVLIRTFLVQAFFIPSGSMERTLHGCPGCSGDKVLVNKLVYDFRDPRPGDIVVFRGPPSWDAEVQVRNPGNAFGRVLRWIGQTVGVAQPDEKDFVKRVIAVGGQTVACCDAKGRVTVDGTPLDEPYVYRSLPDARSQTFGPVTVPKGRLWVMGDHRDGSADSRAHIDDGTSGTVPVDDVIGKAFVIVWPPSRWNTLGTPSTFHSLSSGPLADGVPLGMGLVGALPVVGLRRRRADRLRRRRGPAGSRPRRRGWGRLRRARRHG